MSGDNGMPDPTRGKGGRVSVRSQTVFEEKMSLCLDS